MPAHTETSTLFLDTATDLAERLEQIPSITGASLQHEALELVVTFRAWASVRPTDAERVAAIHRLFDLNRRAMDLLARGGPPSHARPKVYDEDDEEAIPTPRMVGARRGRA